jgi:hypothetical protein
MKLVLGVVVCAFALVASDAMAKPPHRPHHFGHVTPPLTSLPTISRVRIEAARDRVVVVEDVTLPRGDWQKGDMDLYVAFGAPGAPKAFDARVLSLKEGELEALPDDAGDPLATERAPHRPPTAQMLIGRAQMAGALLHLKEAQYRRALVASGGADTAILRTRTLLDLPAEDAQTGRELIVRLGVPGENPLTLGRVQIVSLEQRPWITRAEAQLCGPEADPWPLSIGLTPKPTTPPPVLPKGPIVPRMALRHATDDLCIRFWTAP